MSDTETAEIVDVEPIEDDESGAELVHQPLGQVSIYQSTDAKAQLDEARARATVLVEVVKEQKLAKSFGKGKPHVFVEGWQFLASQFGLIPEIEWTKELDGGKGWEARASLKRLSDGMVISHADGECRNTESNWKGRDSYAIRSMAQTRAVSKVCRVALSSVMVMAGFSATPAEEMDGFADEGPKSPDDPHCPACLKATGELVGVWENDKKPFFKCKNKDQCAAFDGKYAWSGWRSDFKNSVAEWEGSIVQDDPQETTFDPNVRANHSGMIVNEIMAVLGLDKPDDAKALIKPGLDLAVSEGSVDGAAALGGPPSDPPTDDELRVIVTQLTFTEAEAVVAAAASLAPK